LKYVTVKIAQTAKENNGGILNYSVGQVLPSSAVLTPPRTVSN